jgi:predicted dehydrogenase
MEPIKAIVLGAGSRGQWSYGQYGLNNPQDINFIAVAEPDKGRREEFVRNHKVDQENVFEDWREALKRDKFADLVCVCVQDRMHFEPAMAAMDLGYDILLEKPISPTYEECKLLAEKAKEKGVSVGVAHVLRYTPFFETIKRLVDGGEYGKIKGIDLRENVGHLHYSHSYVRGNWRNEAISTPMILAKSCHDLDILLYLIGSNCTELSSYGNKGYFSAKNKPSDAPDRCLDGCSHRDTCPYYAPKIYLNGNIGWPTNVITTDLTTEGITEALREGPYGRCVFSCDNDMTEHQVVAIKFANDVCASFSMSAFTEETTRSIKIMMDNGEIIGDLVTDSIRVVNYSTREVKKINHIVSGTSGHAGGDAGFMKDFIEHLKDKEHFPLKTSIDIALESHKMAFAAHKSMIEDEAIDMSKF